MTAIAFRDSPPWIDRRVRRAACDGRTGRAPAVATPSSRCGSDGQHPSALAWTSPATCTSASARGTGASSGSTRLTARSRSSGRRRRRSMGSPPRPTAMYMRRWRRPDPREDLQGGPQGEASGSGNEGMILPNGLAFDDRGTLYVTESFSMSRQGTARGIWCIPPNGAAEVWLRHPLLTGIGLFGNPRWGPMASLLPRDLFVTNTTRSWSCGSRWRRMQRREVEVWKSSRRCGNPTRGHPFRSCRRSRSTCTGTDLTILTRNAVVRLMADTGSSRASRCSGRGPGPSALFDTPASLAFGTGAGEQQNLFVTNLGWM